jgi:hypothetical protein
MWPCSRWPAVLVMPQRRLNAFLRLVPSAPALSLLSEVPSQPLNTYLGRLAIFLKTLKVRDDSKNTGLALFAGSE